MSEEFDWDRLGPRSLRDIVAEIAEESKALLYVGDGRFAFWRNNSQNNIRTEYVNNESNKKHVVCFHRVDIHDVLLLKELNETLLFGTPISSQSQKHIDSQNLDRFQRVTDVSLTHSQQISNSEGSAQSNNSAPPRLSSLDARELWSRGHYDGDSSVFGYEMGETPSLYEPRIQDDFHRQREFLALENWLVLCVLLDCALWILVLLSHLIHSLSFGTSFKESMGIEAGLCLAWNSGLDLWVLLQPKRHTRMILTFTLFSLCVSVSFTISSVSAICGILRILPLFLTGMLLDTL
uniref:Uncharacterized protein n=1 Tax=Timspurckia oligopyrenoides TaxID=708627 RepID=A0A7S0ZCP7_9RHOD|mmetsp:Transcript_12546/g.22625  ORF Transcript_12546/g.22625 Transcript_12546/m.22625 type:complete len:293 (+) Transcript_12546:86-964(+)